MALLPLVVFCAGATSSVVHQVAAGRNVAIVVGTVGQIRKRIAAGEHADVIIVSAPAMRKFQATGIVIAGTRADLGRTGMGVGVRAGSPFPDISTTNALKRTLLRARSIAATDPAAGASSGIYFAGLLRKMGIADAVKPKEHLTPGGHSCDLVVRRQADICVQNVTEILPVKGVALAGTFPPAMQHYITYTAAVSAKSHAAAAARGFIAALTAPGRAGLWRRAGFQ